MVWIRFSRAHGGLEEAEMGLTLMSLPALDPAFAALDARRTDSSSADPAVLVGLLLIAMSANACMSKSIDNAATRSSQKYIASGL